MQNSVKRAVMYFCFKMVLTANEVRLRLEYTMVIRLRIYYGIVQLAIIRTLRYTLQSCDINIRR